MEPAAEAKNLTGKEALAILEQLQAEGHVSAALVQEKLAAVRGGIHSQTRDRVEASATVSQGERKSEVTTEVLAECLQGLEADYKRGIVVVDDTKTVDDFKLLLKEDKTAGTSWEQVHARLLANDSALLKKAAGMQDKGQLIGVYANGELCIKDRGTEPVIFGNVGGEKVTITTGTANRAELHQNVEDKGQFADYWEIRDAVIEDGFTLPPDSPNHEKKGIVAAIEAVTDTNVVRSANGREWRSMILDCGNVSRSASVGVVRFFPPDGSAYVNNVNPEFRDGERGAVRVLRG